MLKQLIIVIVVFIIATTVYHPDRHAKHYDYIEDTEVLNELIPDPRIRKETNLGDCNYEEILLNNVEIYAGDVYKSYGFHLPNEGGEYRPANCNPLYRTAILVPYRNREEQLSIFINYIHHYLQKLLIHYKIFIVEQNNTGLFNRAKMFNVGALEAIKQNFSCLILHDVDLLPLSSGNIYACSKFPRHMSSSLDTFRFNLPYLGLMGGVISIQTNQFEAVNGMSNMYDGWGGEDDDFYTRLRNQDYIPYRFSPDLSKYTMLLHKKEKPSADRYEKLHNSLNRQMIDGLNSMKRDYGIKLRPLYTHIYAP
ncbi:PREDICTED: beta-1,4-galactosyltransferase 6 [Nicrophorus vespilloides]|uniref:Beta-1,4-N-acetylgalactosaminyltransferase n=1 Tax=Nicrophorus vespilloides TaxID=110193 RepID=A0ABM1MHM0_NICVS|nr:PREDICTED: beta-1,4-galactosyltransferase 6 [Nicrophorus vespilloides]